jgi:hypothetical protein
MEGRIKQGVLHEVNSTPRGLLEACAKNMDYKFRSGEVFHFRAPMPSGVSDSGWAVPEILMQYVSLFQLQVYRKADFAIARDYLLPFRVFTPNIGTNIGDTLTTILMSRWKSEMQRMISTRRKDPTAIHALPFPANMESYGGDGKNMIMHEVIEVYMDALFDGLGIPRELFRGTMNIEQMPNSVRLFERHYEWLYRQLDGLLRFVTSTVQRALGVDEIGVKLKRPTMAYTAEWMQLKMQMAANREIPRTDVYPEMGVQDPEAAAVRAVEEDQNIERRVAELSTKFEKEKTQGSMADMAMMAAEQGVEAGAAPGPGGAPGGAPPGPDGAPEGGDLDYSVDPGGDPLKIQERAQQIASTWLQMHQQQPNSHRKEMEKCEAINPTLYAAAKQAMEEQRSQAASAGRAQAGAPPQ